MYILNGITYKTKIATQKAIQAKIKELNLCSIDERHFDFSFFCDLIFLHENRENKIGCGLKQFHIRHNAMNYNERTLFVERIDGTEESWSYKACLNIKQNDLTAALRSAIEPQTELYKTFAKRECCYCNTLLGPFHTDHKTTPFSKIKDDFLKTTKKEPPKKFGKDNIKFNVIFLDIDTEFKNEWFLYHQSVADYQILCASCNIKKSNFISP
jgi:hypothetical protein